MNAIEKLHESGIYHGDLKSANILIDSDGHLMLADFGLTKCRTDDNWEKACKNDFVYVSNMCYSLFSELSDDKNEHSLIKLLQNMTDTQMHGKWFWHFLFGLSVFFSLYILKMRLSLFSCRTEGTFVLRWSWLAESGWKEIRSTIQTIWDSSGFKRPTRSRWIIRTQYSYIRSVRDWTVSR